MLDELTYSWNSGFMPKRSSIETVNEAPISVNFHVVQKLSGEKPVADVSLSSALDNASLRREIMREMGRRGGRKGGVGRANSLTAEKRSDIARKAAFSRWSTTNKSI